MLYTRICRKWHARAYRMSSDTFNKKSPRIPSNICRHAYHIRLPCLWLMLSPTQYGVVMHNTNNDAKWLAEENSHLLSCCTSQRPAKRNHVCIFKFELVLHRLAALLESDRTARIYCVTQFEATYSFSFGNQDRIGKKLILLWI